MHGSSSSPVFKGSGSWGSYVLWINKSLQSNGCSGINLQPAVSNPFIDEDIPNLVLTTQLSDFSFTVENDFSNSFFQQVDII